MHLVRLFLLVHTPFMQGSKYLYVSCVFLLVSKNLYEGGDEKHEINLVWPNYGCSSIVNLGNGGMF